MKWPLVTRTHFDNELRHRDELAAANTHALIGEVRRLTDYSTKLEALIDLERERYEAERKRADRLQDNLATQAGLPPATETVLGERHAEDFAAEEAQKTMRRQMKELFSEQLNVVHDELGLELPPELEAGVSQMMKEVE